MNKFLICILIAGISSVMTGCFDSKAGETLDKAVVDVVVETTKNLDDASEMSYSGTIEESESIPLTFSTIGSVSRVLVSEGDFVRKGQLLAVLNDETFSNAYEMALATQKQAEDAYNRLLPMYKNGNLPEIKFVEVETAVHHAKFATLIAKKSLNDCKLYSPVDGIVGKRSIDPGMSALPNMSSINIVKIEKVFARVSISENEIASIKKGQKANIMVSALNNANYSGIVEEIGVMADPLSHTYKIKIGITNKNRDIKPGMICNVSLDKPNNDVSGLVVPGRAVLVDENGKNYVYAVKQNKAVRKYVSTGKLMKNGVAITQGLEKGEQIVVSGQHKLVDNSLIRIVKG